MILYQGKRYENNEQARLLAELPTQCYHTLAHAPSLTPNQVIEACDQLVQQVRSGHYDSIILPLLQTHGLSETDLQRHLAMMTRDALEQKLEVELGSPSLELSPLPSGTKRAYAPLGILLHIAAGNVEVLPAYSVIEGLLTGNINLLKLPRGDQGLSILLLEALLRFEPLLQDYIYVFDVPSTDFTSLQQLATLADGIIVWGSDEAVQATRSLAPINSTIIEWGHKLSFAYASSDVSDDRLRSFAHHIASTNQLLCSSAQGIYVDTDSREELDAFATRFFPILQEIAATYPPIPIGIRGQHAIQRRYEELEAHQSGKKLWVAPGVSVTTSEDSKLELSWLYRHVWIKRLPRDQILSTLKPHKNHLQTAGLMVTSHEESLRHLLFRAGVVRVTSPEAMSEVEVGMSHDGKFPLAQYVRIIEWQ